MKTAAIALSLLAAAFLLGRHAATAQAGTTSQAGTPAPSLQAGAPSSPVPQPSPPQTDLLVAAKTAAVLGVAGTQLKDRRDLEPEQLPRRPEGRGSDAGVGALQGGLPHRGRRPRAGRHRVAEGRRPRQAREAGGRTEGLPRTPGADARYADPLVGRSGRGGGKQPAGKVAEKFKDYVKKLPRPGGAPTRRPAPGAAP